MFHHSGPIETHHPSQEPPPQYEEVEVFVFCEWQRGWYSQSSGWHLYNDPDSASIDQSISVDIKNAEWRKIK